MALKHPLKIAIFALLVIAIPRTGGAQSQGAAAAVAQQPCREGVTLGRWYPVEIASNKIFVFGRINGSRPLRFIIDTGAPSGFIDEDLVEALGFRRETSSRGAGSAGSSEVVLTRLEPPACQEVAGGVIGNERFGALKLSEISAVEGLRVEGLVGGDFFNRHVVDVDYRKRRIRMLPSSFAYRGNGISIPISIERGHIYTTASVENANGQRAEGKFMIDTGFRTALSFTGPFATTHHLTDRAPFIREATMGIGAGGESRAKIFRLRLLEIGSLHWNDLVATASLDEKGLLARSDLAGVVGGDLLRRYHLILDYPEQRLILEEYRPFDSRFEYDESGLFLVAEPPALKRVRVLRVIPGSPGQQAGLAEGDVLVSIGSRLVADTSLDRLRHMLCRDGITYRIVVSRDRQVVTAVLHTRQLFSMEGSADTLKDSLPAQPAEPAN